MNVQEFIEHRMEKTASRAKAFSRGFQRGAGRGFTRGGAFGAGAGSIYGATVGDAVNQLAGRKSNPMRSAAEGAAMMGISVGGISALANGIFQGVKEMRKAGVKPTVPKVKKVGRSILGRTPKNSELKAAGIITAGGALTMVGMGIRSPKKKGMKKTAAGRLKLPEAMKKELLMKSTLRDPVKVPLSKKNLGALAGQTLPSPSFPRKKKL